MLAIRRSVTTRSGLLLAIVLIAAQWVLSAHAASHDAGPFQNPLCAACVMADELGSATVDCTPELTGVEHEFAKHAPAAGRPVTVHTLAVRQRGPPLSI